MANLQDRIIEALQPQRGKWGVIGRTTGVSVELVRRLASARYTHSPRYSTLLKLAAYLGVPE